MASVRGAGELRPVNMRGCSGSAGTSAVPNRRSCTGRAASSGSGAAGESQPGDLPESALRLGSADSRQAAVRRCTADWTYSTIISTSTGESRGSTGTPTAERASWPASPKIFAEQRGTVDYGRLSGEVHLGGHRSPQPYDVAERGPGHQSRT